MKLMQNSGVPIYQQIADSFKTDILAGRFCRPASNGSCTGHLYIAGAGPVGFSDRKTGKSQPLNIL